MNHWQYVKLEPGDLLVARDWEAKVQAHLPDRPNQTGMTREDRYYLGYLGEIGLRKWFVQNGVYNFHPVRLFGQSEGPDFYVQQRGCGNKGRRGVDCKAKSEVYARPCLSGSLVTPLKSDFYVAVQLDGDWAAMVGWATRDEYDAADRPTWNGVLMRALPYDQLKSMLEFHAMLIQAEEIQQPPPTE